MRKPWRGQADKVKAEQQKVLAQALVTHFVRKDLRLEAPAKGGTETLIATLPVQQLNGSLGVAMIDLCSTNPAFSTS